MFAFKHVAIYIYWKFWRNESWRTWSTYIRNTRISHGQKNDNESSYLNTLEAQLGRPHTSMIKGQLIFYLFRCLDLKDLKNKYMRLNIKMSCSLQFSKKGSAKATSQYLTINIYQKNEKIVADFNIVFKTNKIILLLSQTVW